MEAFENLQFESEVYFKLRAGVVQVGRVDIRHVQTHDEQRAEYDSSCKKLDIVFSETPDRIELILNRELFREYVEGTHRGCYKVRVVLSDDERHGVFD